MAGFYNHVGLNISNSKLQLVEIFSGPEQIRLDNIAEVNFSERINFKKDKSTKILAQLQSAYDEIRLSKSIRSKKFSFALPLELFYVVQLPYDNTLLHQDIISEFRWEYSILFPHKDAEEFILVYKQIDKNSFIRQNSAIVYGIERKYLQLLQSFCRQNNLSLGYIDNMHLAAEKALRVSDSYSKRGLSLSVYLTEKNFSLIFTLNGQLIYQSIHKLNSLEDAGRLIKDKIESNKILKVKKGIIQTSYVTGSIPFDKYIGRLNFYTGLNFIKYNPFDRIISGPKIKDDAALKKISNRFSSAAGIAFRIA